MMKSPRDGWAVVVVVVVIVGEYFAHLISSASFHYVIIASAVSSVCFRTYVSH